MRIVLKSIILATEIAVVTFLTISSASAQISVDTVANTYSQNFNTLRTTGGTTFVNDPASDGMNGLDGFYARSSATLNYNADNGSGSPGGSLYSLGSTSNSDRALGSLSSSNANALFHIYGARFRNTSLTSNITGFTISYRGEQWRNGGTGTADTLFFFHSNTNNQTTTIGNDSAAGAVDLANESFAELDNDLNLDTSYTHVAALDFVSPVVTGTAAALNGNLVANSTTFANVTVNLADGVTNGNDLWIRWIDGNDNGSDHQLGIDDLSITFNFTETPEPGTLALLPLGGLALIAVRRCRRQVSGK